MINLNGKLFAKNDEEFVSSLFNPKGTCVGFYKSIKSGVELLNQKKERIGVINNNKVLCCATKIGNGKYWYSFSDIDLIGRYNSYSQYIDEVHSAYNQVKGD